jgi:hypothetical protein
MIAQAGRFPTPARLSNPDLRGKDRHGRVPKWYGWIAQSIFFAALS